MRMLLKISMSVEKANEAAKSGALKQSIESTMQALKPEAAYFYPEDGKRTAIMIFDMQGSWQLPAMVEPLFQQLGASIHVTPVMERRGSPEGIQRSRHVGDRSKPEVGAAGRGIASGEDRPRHRRATCRRT